MSDYMSCHLCERRVGCLKRGATIFCLYTMTHRYDEAEEAKKNLDLGESCGRFKLSTDKLKIVNAATDEIYGSLEVCPTGNYWFSVHWNLFVTKEKEPDCDEYYLLKLEKYDDEDCIDFEYDSEDTASCSEQELRKAIEKIVGRNAFLIKEVLTK